MTKRLDLTGYQSGMLTAIEFHSSNGTRAIWRCHCNPEYGGCGRQDVLVQAGNLRSGNSSSCGCYKKSTGRKDRTGVISGYLRVINYSHTVGKEAYWNCYCDPELGGCGKHKKLRAHELGKTKSCGCGKYYSNITGQKFGRLTAIERVGKYVGSYLWKCICECGTECVVDGHSLRRGGTKSCGCYLTEVRRRSKNVKHGCSKTRDSMYRLWNFIKCKCYLPNHPNYAEGLTVCPEWKHCFVTFRNDVGERPEGSVFLLKPGCTEYNKDNCYWGGYTEVPKYHYHMMTLNGVTKRMVDWSEELGIPYDVLSNRYRNLWSDERALTQPVRTGTRGLGCYTPGSDNYVRRLRRKL